MASSIDMVYYDGIQQEIGFSVKALELSLQWNALIVAQENVCFPVAFSRQMSYKPTYTLFRKKRFEINFFVRQNASKFAIFMEKENPRSFFRFSFRATLSFPL